MPALITHDFFGRDAYDAMRAVIGEDPDARDAFLLGNQGPDPLFYLVAAPRMRPFFGLGSAMHRIDPAPLLLALKEGIGLLDGRRQDAGRAYLAGFCCHYLLDRATHPFIYGQQFALCDAGIQGLSRADGSDVHAEIERDLDEMVLFARTGRTVADYRPHREVLQAHDEILDALGAMVGFASIKAMRAWAPADMFAVAVRNFRRIQGVFYSPSQRRADAAAFVETRVLRRNHSFFKAMSHRVRACDTSIFDNREHAAWKDPFTGGVRREGFWDLFGEALEAAQHDVPALLSPDFDEAAARRLTRGLNFSGEAAPASPKGPDAPRR